MSEDTSLIQLSRNSFVVALSKNAIAAIRNDKSFVFEIKYGLFGKKKVIVMKRSAFEKNMNSFMSKVKKQKSKLGKFFSRRFNAKPYSSKDNPMRRVGKGNL